MCNVFNVYILYKYVFSVSCVQVAVCLPPSAGGKPALYDTVRKAGREKFFLGFSFIYSFVNR